MNERESGAAPRERVAGVLGLGLGLALLVGCGLALALVRPRPLDPAQALAESFALGDLPFGLRPEAARRLASGETLVAFTDGRALGVALDLESALDTESEREREDAVRGLDPVGAEEEEVDWSQLPELDAGTPPARLFLVRHPSESAARALARAFRHIEWKEISEIGPRGGRLAVEGGRLAWGAYAADYVRERRFLPEHSFQDSIRVNLGRPERYWIAYAFWPAGHPGSKERVEELLSALLPLP